MASYARDVRAFLQSQLRNEAGHFLMSNNDHPRTCRDEIDRMFSFFPEQIRFEIERLVTENLANIFKSLTLSRATDSTKKSTLPLQQKPVTQTCSCINRQHRFFATPFGKISIIMGTSTTHIGANECRPQSDFNNSSTQIAFLPGKWLRWLGVTRYLHLNMKHIASFVWYNVLNAPRIIPDDSLIFMYCQQGDVAGMQRLFAEGRASVHDVNSDGLTTLHMTAFNQHAEACRLLISCSADVSARDGLDNRTPLDLATYFIDYLQHGHDRYEHIRYDSEHGRVLQPIPTLRTLLDAGACSEDWNFKLLEIFANLALEDEFVENSKPSCLQDSELPYCWFVKQLVANTYLTSAFSESWAIVCYYSIFLAEGRATAVLEMCPTLAVKTTIRDIIRGPEFFQFMRRTVSETANKPNASHCRTNTNFINLLSEIERRSPTELKFERFVNRLLQLAMEKSQSLVIFVQMILGWKKKTKEYLQNLAARQARLLGGSWTAQKLCTLFDTEFPTPEIYEWERHVKCRECEAAFHYSDACVPLWQLHVERIRQGLDPVGPFEEWERIERTKWTEYIENYEEACLCVECYDEMLRASTEESDPHPGLLEIDI